MTVEAVYLRPDDYELETLSRDIGDIPFWSSLLRRERPKRVLEIGSGCGRLTLPLARLGAEQGFIITGLEMEPAMLRRAQEHARAESADTRRALRLMLGDARDLDGALRHSDGRATTFDVIIMPYGVAHHLTTCDARLSAWRGARRWLRAGGLLAVDVAAPDVARMAAGRVEETPRACDLEVSRDGRTLRRTVATHYDGATQVETHAYEYHVQEPDGAQHDYRSDFQMYVYFPHEIETLFRTTGFTLERLIGSYHGEPFCADSPLQIGLGRAE
ncbi:MAG TPA: class I SAM-dependent methyltransferase [Ktedonobacterales bacterium]